VRACAVVFDAAGLTFWSNLFTTGAVNPGTFILQLEASVNMQVGTADAVTLAAKLTVAEDYCSAFPMRTCRLTRLRRTVLWPRSAQRPPQLLLR
jgi:hypothetical protein